MPPHARARPPCCALGRMSAAQDPSSSETQKESKSRSKNAGPPATPRAAPEPGRGIHGGQHPRGRQPQGDDNPRDGADRDHTYD